MAVNCFQRRTRFSNCAPGGKAFLSPVNSKSAPPRCEAMDGALRDCWLAELIKMLFFCSLLNVNLRNRKLSLV
jgi:hypothetical protein